MTITTSCQTQVVIPENTGNGEVSGTLARSWRVLIVWWEIGKLSLNVQQQPPQTTYKSQSVRQTHHPWLPSRQERSRKVRYTDHGHTAAANPTVLSSTTKIT